MRARNFNKFETKQLTVKNQTGMLIFEVLLGLTLFGVISLGLLRANIAAQEARGKALLNSVASQIAFEAMDEALTSGWINGTTMNLTDSLTRHGHTFNRTRTLTCGTPLTEGCTISINVTQNVSKYVAQTQISAYYPYPGSY